MLVGSLTFEKEMYIRWWWLIFFMSDSTLMPQIISGQKLSPYLARVFVWKIHIPFSSKLSLFFFFFLLYSYLIL